MRLADDRGSDQFHEPVGGEMAGAVNYVVPETPYEMFMRDQGLPVYRGIGVHDVRELELARWERLNGNGAFLYLQGIEEVSGLYVVEIPGGESLNPERHIYEELAFVVRGRGSTEVWSDGGRPTMFEWQAGSLFAIPLNVRHRLVNASKEPALLLVATTAPAAINLFGSGAFVFDNPWEFSDRYDGTPDFFAYREEVLPSPTTSRAMQRTNFIPDIVNSALPLDNQRSRGYRRLEPHMASGRQYIFIGEHEVGRYSMAHSHPAGAVLVCIKGQGYTYTWPKEAGLTPWKSGRSDLVMRQDYVAGGMVVAAPGGGDWLHQHFGVGNESFRLLVFYGLRTPLRFRGQAGQKVTSANVGMRRGGASIDYEDEDPFIRQEFERMLREFGGTSRMG